MIDKVYVWDNNAVMVFDENGNQMQLFQGELAAVRDLILANSSPTTKFFLASWSEAAHQPITREQFMELK